MGQKKSKPVSAQVVLRAASGKKPHGRAAVTAKSLKDYEPSPEAVTEAQEAFTAQGFEVGPMVGNSFSVTAPAETFESVFQTTIRTHKERGVEAVREKTSSYELPLEALPKTLRKHLEAVTFSPPPDFGPTNFGP
jgi:hypothetical protein